MMQKKPTLIYGAILILVGLIIGLGISSSLNLLPDAFTQEANISKESIDILSKTSHAMAEVVAAVKPAVVNISSTKTVKMKGMQSPFSEDPFFRRFFGDNLGHFGQSREHKESGLGSTFSRESWSRA
jgi:S1-C subfamily serine protease